MKNLNLSREVKTIGIWLETPGQAYTVGEGIARVISYLVASWQAQGLKVRIHCSAECATSFRRVMNDLGLSLNEANVSFVTAKEATAVTRWLETKISKFGTKIWRNKKHAFQNLKFVFSVLKVILQKARGNHSLPMPDINLAIRNGLMAAWIIFKLGFIFVAKVVLEKLNKIKFFRTDYKKNLIDKAKKYYPDAWYVPRPDWELANQLGPRVIWAFWDFIPAETLVHFPIDGAIDSVRVAAGSKGEIVTMSNYVKEKHCEKIFGARPENVRAKQPPFHLSVKPLERQQAAQALPRLMREWVKQPAAQRVNARYIVDFPFDKVDFVFMPTQIRGYKNFFNVILAMEEIIRRKRVDVKLVTTGDINSEFATEAAKYLNERGLVFDIVSIPGLSTEALNCFFKLAKVVICPAFSEGGIPLSFMEGVSHGIPVVLSRMANALEFFDLKDPVVQKFTFDPYSVSAIVDSVLYALNNAEQVSQYQRLFIEKTFDYTWDDYSKFVLDQKF